MNAATSAHGVVLVCTIPHLRCRSVTSLTCCTRLAENTGRKNSAKNSPSAHHRTALLDYRPIFATIGKKLLNSDISPTCPHNMVNFGPLVAEIGSLVWGTPANFNGFRYCSDVAQRKPTKLCTICLFGRLLAGTLHFRTLPVTEFSQV